MGGWGLHMAEREEMELIFGRLKQREMKFTGGSGIRGEEKEQGWLAVWRER